MKITKKDIFYIITIIVLCLIIGARGYFDGQRIKKIDKELEISKQRVELLRYSKTLLQNTISDRKVEIDSLLIVVSRIPDIDSLYTYNKKNHDKKINNIRKLDADSSIKLFAEWTSKLN